MTSILSGLRRSSSGEVRSISFQDVWGQGLDWSDITKSPSVRQMSITATLACVDVKAASISAMPLHEYRKVGELRERTPKLSPLIDDPSDLFSPEEWIYAAVASLTLWDEALGMIRSNGANGWPDKIEWLVPDDVDSRIESGRVAYYVKGVRHTPFKFGGDIVHVRRRPIPGAPGGGMSVSKAIAPLITVGLEGARAVASTYLSGGLPLSALTWDGELQQEEADTISQRYVDKRSAHPGRPLVIGKGWKFETFNRENVTADLAAIRKQIATEIAVAHSVPPEIVGGETGGSMTYSNLEGLTRHLEVRTLLPIYTPFERALSRLLPQPRFVRFNADATIRTSLLDRMRSHDIAIRAGMRSPNEARRIEDEPPIPGGVGGQFLWPPYASSVQATGEATP